MNSAICSMFVLYRSKIVGVGLSLVVGLAAGGATPNFAQAALSPEAKCREAVARATRKAASLTVNARAKCIKQRLKFKIGAGVDCMADPPGLGGPGTGDDKTDAQLLKLAKYRDSQVKRIPRSCSGIDLGALGVADVCVPSSTNAAEVAECAVMELGKPAGDSLTQLINVPQPVVPTKSLARKCYEIINRGIRQNERKLNLLRGDCFETAEELGQSSAGCLATIAPPGIVDTTGFAEIDEKLIKRPLKFRGRVWTFCQDIDFDSIGFDAILPDYTPPPFTLDDAFGVLYDGLLHEVTIINSIIFPPLSYCGDSNVDPGEECDDGDRLSCDGCDRDCSIPACGNGASCDLELCDDGNPFNGDGCDTSCVSEVCGNGVLQAGIGEECDDGVANSDVLPDACRTDCREPYCGDHIVDTGEACDPPDGDQCEPNCTSPNCGDGIVDPGEECDDGVANSDVAPDACRSDCSDPSCGDNVVDSTEQCDPPDGGVTCKVDCTFVTCGNGIFEPGFGEECDDGAGNSDSAPDACRTDCRLPSCGDGVSDSGEVCDTAGNSAFCDADCTSASCGDGFANGAAGEQCDDANPVEGDGCDSNCTFTACGNGIPTGGELCDDGNTTPGDGCSATCTCGPGSGETGPCGNQDLQCPDKVDLVLFAGTTGISCANDGDCEVGTCDTGIGRCVTVSELDTGWKGIAHDADIVDQVLTRANLFCEGPAPTCGECFVSGLDPALRTCRCASDNRQICDEPFRSDADDCGGGTCNCYFGVPLPLSSGNTPACVVNKFRSDLAGTVNVDTGDAVTSTRLASQVYLGPSPIEPCPTCGGTCTSGDIGLACATDMACDVCIGGTNNGNPCGDNAQACRNGGGDCGNGVCGNHDPTPNDGVRGGTCVRGENAGLSCDAGSRHESFTAPGGTRHSLDCFPSTGSNVSGASGLSIDLDQTTGLSEFTASVPCASFSCHCGLCDGESPPKTPCKSDAECGVLGLGTCKTTLPNVLQALPNTCQGAPPLQCTDIGGGEGSCVNNAPDSFCDGITRASGLGFIQCFSNADCAPFGPEAGDCTLSSTRECFLPTISAQGIADPQYPVGVAAFCVPPTSNSAINSVAGLPGPGRIVNQGKTTYFCASDPGTAYVPNVGGCP